VPFSLSNGGGADGAMGEKDKMPKKKKKEPVRPAADQTVVNSASTALKSWVSRREEELAVEWCEKEEGVELVWGKTCDEPKCECMKSGYPGWEEWYGQEEEDR
jgi:hypothetical protein